MYEKTLLDVPGATLPFYTYTYEGHTFIEFDARACQPPEPMINAMRGFELIEGSDKHLVMLNVHEPTPLYQRVADSMVWDVDVLESGDMKIVFRKKD